MFKTVKTAFLKLIFSIGIVVFIFSCESQNTVKKGTLSQERLKSKISNLLAKQTKLTKYIFTEGKSDTVEIQPKEFNDWEKELNLFFKNDLKLNQLERYELDSSYVGLDEVFEYTAKDSNLTTRNYLLKLKEDKSFKLIIDVVKSSQLYDFKYHLEFISQEGYLIESSQKVESTFDLNYRVEGKFKE